VKITNAYIERTYNLGNYESLKVGFEAVLSEADKPLEVTRDLENLAHQHYENTKAGHKGTVAPSQTVTQTAPVTSTLKPENTVKRETAKADSTKCPKCGANKKPQYDLCYTCFEEEKAN